MFTIVIDRPGDSSLELTPITESCKWDSAAVGGFGSCTFAVSGLVKASDLPYLATVRLYYGTLQLWEGRIEDRTFDFAGRKTTVQAFGWSRLLTDATLTRVWSKRNFAWVEIGGGRGATIFNTVVKSDMTPVAGQYDPLDLTKIGVRVAGNGVAVTNIGGNGVIYTIPSGITGVKLLGTYAKAGPSSASFEAQVTYSTTAASGTWGGSVLSAGAFNVSTPGNYLGLVAYNVSGGPVTPTSADQFDFSDMRLLGTSLTEDASGGFYGSSILSDLVALIPGLAPGTVETGSDFLIQALERSTRDTGRSVVDEVVGYYGREWAVWENGRFDWITPNLDEPQYVLTLSDCMALDLTGSLDTLVKRSYVLYTDAASGITSEASADAVSQRNPFVRTGQTKDDLTDISFPMTANTSAQLAARIAAERGLYPPVTGRLTIQARRAVKDETGTSVPAFAIRAGRNIYIPDLPRDDVFSTGRDGGQTLFHVVTCEADMTEQTVTLELEGQGRQMDVILSRLAAVTRTITG